MRSLAIAFAYVEVDHLHRLFYGRRLAGIELLCPLFVSTVVGWLIGNAGSPEGGDEPLKLLLEGLEEPLDDLGLGIVTLRESYSDIEPGEDAAQFLVQVMIFPLFMKEL
jgi:hypothetical protein